MSLQQTEAGHDLERWGAVWSADPEPRELVRMACVVRRLVDDRTPLRYAAQLLVQQLQAHKISEFFELRPGDRARLMDPKDLWIPHQRMPSVQPDGRPGTPFNQPPWRVMPGSSPWAQFDAEPDLIGIPGLLACLQSSWGQAAAADAELDLDLAGRLAMLRTDADRIVPSEAMASARVVQLTLVSAGATSSFTEETKKFIATLKCPKKAGINWSASHRADLLKQHVALTSAPHNLLVKVSHAELAEVWKVGEHTIKAALVEARRVDKKSKTTGGKKSAAT